MVCKILKQILVTLVLYHPISVICGTVTPANGNNTVSGVKGQSIHLKWNIDAASDEIIDSVKILEAGRGVSSFFLKDDPNTWNGEKDVSYPGDLKKRLKVSYHSKDAKKSGTVTLSLTNLNYQDKLNFTCEVTFRKPSDRNYFKLVSSEIHIININEKPHFCNNALPTSFELTNRTLMLLICGNPMPSLTWKIGNEQEVTGELKDYFNHSYSYEITPSNRFCGQNLSLEVSGFNGTIIKKDILVTMEQFTPGKIKDVNVKLIGNCPVITFIPEDTGKCHMSYEYSSASPTDGKLHNITLDVQNSFNFCAVNKSLENLTDVKIRSVYKAVNGPWSEPFSIWEPSKSNDKGKSSGPDSTIIAVIVVLTVLIILVTVVILCALQRRKREGNPASIEMEGSNRALQNEYVISAVPSSNPIVVDEQNRTLYSELGTGGGRIPGSNPAQQCVVPESNYASVKVDEKGYPMRSLDTIESNQIKHAGFGLMSKNPK